LHSALGTVGLDHVEAEEEPVACLHAVTVLRCVTLEVVDVVADE